ncbi:hypothetical protein [Streptomyces sp. GC420]|uniref:hypothetical protein n=1 Tax=Streptomyces sp. GC420 TaxID=2697568 RepID=UPI001414E8B1|nr:hypothetical protein [Streptomyces sp. GC420]NBM14976.1 hypothetical protein [Streptomyces sp. GC420]
MDRMEWLGLFYIVLFLGTPVGIGVWIGKKYGPTMQRNKRKRQIETAVLMHSVDAELYGEVLDDLHDRRNRRH